MTRQQDNKQTKRQKAKKENGKYQLNLWNACYYTLRKAGVLDEHIEEVLAVAKENNIYIDYLKNKGSSLERLSEYIHNMAKLDDNILQMAMYLSFVVICIVSLTKFKYRKGFYVASAIVYLIAMTSIFQMG